MTGTETHNKTKEIQVARLLNWMGTDALKMYTTLVTEKDTDNDVFKILDLMEKYCSPRNNKIMAHYKFFKAKKNDDNFDVYFIRLK